VYRRCAIIKKEGEAHLKDKKLKRTAIFIGIFAAVILLSIIFMRVFRPPPEPEPLFPTTGEITSTTEEESTTEPPEGTTEPTTATMPDTTTCTATAATARTSAVAARTTTEASRPATTRAPSITTRAPVTTTKPSATTTRTTTRSTTTTRQTTTTTRQTTTTSAADSLIANGIDYGKSIGLTYRPQLTQGGEAISGATQQAIRAKLDQAKAAGARQFNIWTERQANGSQKIFIATGR